MTNRIPTYVLALGVAALAGGDWLVGGVIADGPDDGQRPVAEAPSEVEVEEALAGPGVRAAVQGCQVTLERVGERGYQLRVHNPSDAPVTVGLEIESWETSGSNVGRMGPRARKQTAETFRATVAPRATVFRSLKYQDPAPAKAEGDAKLPEELRRALNFRQLDFVLRPAVQREEQVEGRKAKPAAELARLRLPERPVTATAETPSTKKPAVIEASRNGIGG